MRCRQFYLSVAALVHKIAKTFSQPVIKATAGSPVPKKIQQVYATPSTVNTILLAGRILQPLSPGFFYFTFLPRCIECNAVLVIVKPSVCPFVKRVHCDKRKHLAKKFNYD